MKTSTQSMLTVGGEAGEFSLPLSAVYDRRSPGRWVLSHLSRHALAVLYVALGTVLFIGLRSYIPILVGDAFEIVTSGSSQESLRRVALLIVVVAVVHGIVNLTTAYCNETVAQRLERDARDELFVSLLSKSQTFHDRQRVGDVMARATNDVRQLNLMISPALNLIFQSSLALILPLIYIAFIDLRLLAAPTIFVVSAGFALRRYVRTLGPISTRLRREFGDMNAVLNESLSNVKLVRNFVQEVRERDVFRNAARLYRDTFIANGDAQARYYPLLYLGLATGGGLAHALFLQARGAISFGDVVSYLGLLQVLRFPTFISIFSFNLVQMGLASARRILLLMNGTSEIDENLEGHAGTMQGSLCFRNVSFRYGDDGPMVLRNISFEAPAGTRVAIVGPTGSGKTTLIKLLQRLYDVTEGTIEVDGIDVRHWQLSSLRGQIGSIEQDTFLFSRSIADNIAFACPGAGMAEIRVAAQTAQADGFISEFKHGYDTEVGSRGVTLSGGQKQRIAIARAFLANPRVLTIDDGTSAVDSATEDQIRKAMEGLLKDRTSVIISHRLAQIRHADLILVMEGGRVVAQGDHSVLIRKSPEYRGIFEVYGAVLPPLESP